MIRPRSIAICCALTLAAIATAPAETAQIQASLPGVLPSYVTLAKQIVGAPLVLDARIRSAVKIKGAEAATVPPGHVRFYIEADVLGLIRGPAGVATRIGYVADLPLGPRGKEPKLKKQRVLLFARPVTGRADQIQLTGLESQRSYAPELDAQVRGIIKEVVAADAPPAITGVGNAFHVPGALPGEGETQVFLQTASGAPVSLQVLRRPGEQRRWSVSLGDIVDDSAGPPAPDTLLWFRLVCGLPRTLPAESVATDDPANAAAAREDYALVLRQLGRCA